MYVYAHDLVRVIDFIEAQGESEERQDPYKCHARLLRLQQLLN